MLESEAGPPLALSEMEVRMLVADDAELTPISLGLLGPEAVVIAVELCALLALLATDNSVLVAERMVMTPDKPLPDIKGAVLVAGSREVSVPSMLPESDTPLLPPTEARALDFIAHHLRPSSKSC